MEDEGGVGARQSVLVELRTITARATSVSALATARRPAARAMARRAPLHTWLIVLQCAANASLQLATCASAPRPSQRARRMMPPEKMLALGRLGPRKRRFFCDRQRAALDTTSRAAQLRVRGARRCTHRQRHYLSFESASTGAPARDRPFFSTVRAKEKTKLLGLFSSVIRLFCF